MRPKKFKLYIIFLFVIGLTNYTYSQQLIVDTSFEETKVQFQNANTSIAGSLLLPKTKKPFPVVIFIHGDGPTNRDFYGYYRSIWKQFTKIGFACFAWDKPGVGESISPYGKYDRNNPISFLQRAAELRKAIDYLKTRNDIDTTQIGTWAISQGGWITSMVASQTKDISFMIEVSCAGQPAIIQSEFQIALQMKDEGKSNQMIRNRIQKFRKENDSLPKLNINKSFLQFLAGKQNDWTQTYSRSADDDGSFFIDPKPFLEKITCPVLAIYGDKDRNVNYKISSNAYKLSLKNNSDFLFKVFKNADHILFNSTTGQDSEWRKKLVVDKNYDYVEGYIDLMTTWLTNHKIN